VKRTLVWALLALTLASDPGQAYEQRTGTFSAGLQGHVSSIFAAHDSYGAFRWRGNPFNGESIKGPAAGLAVRFRISLDRTSAIGLSFEALDFKRSLPRTELADFEIVVQDTVTKLHASAVSFDYYRYFRRKAKTTPYAVGGIGFYRPERRFGEIQTKILTSGLLLTLGGGLEHFFSRNLSLEPSLRFFALRHDGGISGAAELAVGVRFYMLSRRTRR